MPKRIPHQSIVLYRDGKQVRPDIGKPFDFTQDELDDIKATNPDAIRHIVNEELPATAAEQAAAREAAEAAAKAAATKSPAKGKAASASDEPL